MLTQAMAIFQQDQLVPFQSFRRDRTEPAEGVVGGDGGQEGVIGHPLGLQPDGVIGQGDQGGVQGAGFQRSDQFLSQVLAQEQAQLGELIAQHGQGAWQQERRDGRDDPQPEAAGQGLAGAVGRLHQILGLGQDLFRPAHRLFADRGQNHARARPVDHRGAQHLFQFANAG